MSVVITAFNHESYIGDAVRSVLAQTYRDYEVIVVDDGSSDATTERVAAFGPDVRLVRQANQGVASSRNTGVRHTRGRLLAFLDGDDVWEPDKLARQVTAAEQNPSSGLIAVNGTELRSPAGPSNSLLAPPVEALLAGMEALTIRCYDLFLRQNLVCTTSQVMIPRSVLDDVGPSDPAFRISSDWDLYLRISSRYHATFLSRRLVGWRYLESSASGPLAVRHLRWAADSIAILKKHLRLDSAAYRPLIRRLVREKILETANAAYSFGRETDRSVARRLLLRLLRSNPTSPWFIVLFLVGLHCPDFLTRSVGPLLRRAFRAPNG